MQSIVIPNTNAAAVDAVALLGPLSQYRPKVLKHRTGLIQADRYVLDLPDRDSGAFKRLMRDAGHDVGFLMQ